MPEISKITEIPKQTHLNRVPLGNDIIQAPHPCKRQMILDSPDIGYLAGFCVQTTTPKGQCSDTPSSHIHPDCLWSGVYYVKTPANCGVIEFTDPRTPNLMRKGVFDPKKKRLRECWSSVKYNPVAGKMLVFPAWLYHAVMPNMSTADGTDVDRVIISFNLSQRRNS